jgi:hypothetical protein
MKKTKNKLYELQGSHIEESIYVSMRMLEERRNLLQLMAAMRRRMAMPKSRQRTGNKPPKWISI